VNATILRMPPPVTFLLLVFSLFAGKPLEGESAFAAAPPIQTGPKTKAASPLGSRPNIILIVPDDLGYSDLGCYGSEIRTPALDVLAMDGVGDSQFYNAARCCPSRACLLTGVYPHQAGVGHMTCDAGEPGYRRELSKDVPTIAEVLKKSGYFTAMSGKWHVTANSKPDSARDNWPCQRGFDELYGTLPGHGSREQSHTTIRSSLGKGCFDRARRSCPGWGDGD